jgi:hypothetical protein
MGGRKGFDSKVVFGQSKSVEENISKLQSTLQDGDNEKTVLQALKVLAVSDPAIRTVLLTAKVLKLAYEIYSETEKEYEKTGDYDSAVSSAVVKVVGRTIGDKKEIIIENGIKICWNEVKQENCIETSNNEVDAIVTSVFSDVIMETIQ